MSGSTRAQQAREIVVAAFNNEFGVDGWIEGRLEKELSARFAAALSAVSRDAITTVKEMRDKWKNGTESHSREDPYREHCRVSMRAANEIITELEKSAAGPERCNFCGKSETEVLIPATIGYICNSCVQICAAIMQNG